MATVDCFLLIDGIKGETADATMKSKFGIDIQSWSWGETNMGMGMQAGGGGAGKVQMQDFQFTKSVDKSSPELMLACAEGRHIPTATLICRKAGKDQQEYMTIKFADLLISSFQGGCNGNGDLVPTERISFNFAKIEISYKPQKADGTLDAAIRTGWDRKANKKVA
ncbi:MAG: type VI secretion system tube protein Hcp [Gemmataceae bacterium]|nr:type VI secretion system tube protein Hcp [Gemmataceae bacterium]MCI0737449.1 type VI secretion system tube protein Hcp [Gemmataceae bacterium]